MIVAQQMFWATACLISPTCSLDARGCTWSHTNSRLKSAAASQFILVTSLHRTWPGTAGMCVIAPKGRTRSQARLSPGYLDDSWTFWVWICRHRAPLPLIIHVSPCHRHTVCFYGCRDVLPLSLSSSTSFFFLYLSSVSFPLADGFTPTGRGRRL